MDDQLKISETNKEKNQIIVNKKYKFNLWYITNHTKVFKCTEYKTIKKLIKYENKHTHPGKEYDASVSIVKHKMKNEIRKTSIPFDINPKHIYNEISEEIGLICPEYNSIKSQISRYIKKQLPPDISKFNEIPDESEYYINERDKNFMIFKNSNIIIFQSPFQTELFIKYNENMFADGTFYIEPIFGYQVFITRIYAPEINKQATYELLFEELKKNASISNAAIKIFPNITIKYCVWHYKRSLEVQKNKLCYNEVEKSFNNYLKKLFYKKPSFYELIYHLKREESLSYNNYKRKIEGEFELIDKICDKNDIIDLWYKCLLELNKL
ncbi:hypothetical protein H8356DRAFT_1432913 [Neocallimastix lanati (nom. inval.)]|nr:hypothetical protein H8356DRAFT_1432913 [Neocallimastix sp. JGI-2020a]